MRLHILPLQGQPKVFVKNMDPSAAAQYAEVVARPEEADFAILRLETPWVPVETKNPFARGFHHGDLDFKGEAKAEILSLLTDRAYDCGAVSGSPGCHPRNQRCGKGFAGRVWRQRHSGAGCALWQSQPGRQIAI